MKQFAAIIFFLCSFLMIFPGKAMPVEILSHTDVRKALPADYKNWQYRVAETCVLDTDKAFRISAYAKIQDGKTLKEVLVEMLATVEIVDSEIHSSEINEFLIAYIKISGMENIIEGYGYLAVDNQWNRYNFIDQGEEKEYSRLSDEALQKHYGVTLSALKKYENCQNLDKGFSEFSEKLDKAMREAAMKTEEFQKEYGKSP